MTSLLRRRQHRGQPFGRVSGSAAVSGDRTARRSRPPGYRLRNRMKDQAEEHMWIMKAARTPSTCARESKGRCNRVPLTKGPGHSGECEKPVALASEAATSGRFSLLWFLLEKAETLEYWPIPRECAKAASQPKASGVRSEIWLGEWNSNHRGCG